MTQEDTDDIEVTIQDDETVESSEESAEEQLNDRLAKAEAEAAKYRRLFEKSQKPKVEEPKADVQPLVDVEAVAIKAALKVQGMDETLIKELETISKAKNISLTDAQNDPWFVASKEKFDKDAKAKAASLGASRGSGQVKERKTLNTPGLTREEHRRMVMDM